MSTKYDGKQIPLKDLNIQIKKIEEMYKKYESYKLFQITDPISKEKDSNKYYIHTSILTKLKEFGIPDDFFNSTLFSESYPYLMMDNIFYRNQLLLNKYKTLRKINKNRITKKQQKYIYEFEKAYLLFSCIYPFYLGKYGFDSQSNKSIFVGPFIIEKKGKKENESNIDIDLTYNSKAMITFGIESGSYEKSYNLVSGNENQEHEKQIKTNNLGTKETIPLYTIFSFESFQKWKTSMDDVLMATGFLNADNNTRIQIIQGTFFNTNNVKQAIEPYLMRDEDNYNLKSKKRLKFKIFFGITENKKPIRFFANLRKQMKKYRDAKKLEDDIKKDLSDGKKDNNNNDLLEAKDATASSSETKDATSSSSKTDNNNSLSDINENE